MPRARPITWSRFPTGASYSPAFAVTPASGYILPWGGLVIGLIAGVACYGSVFAKTIFKYDDSLDAFGVHGVGGFLGAILTSVFASYLIWNDAAGNTPASR